MSSRDREAVAVMAAMLLLLVAIQIAGILHPVAMTFLVSCCVSGILLVAIGRR